jgi:putative transposase
VLVPKYRYSVFGKPVKIAVRDEIKKLCLWLQVKILEGHVCKDHIHLSVTIPPKYSISEVIATFKGKSTIRLYNKFPDLRKQYWGSHFWSRG